MRDRAKSMMVAASLAVSAAIGCRPSSPNRAPEPAPPPPLAHSLENRTSPPPAVSEQPSVSQRAPSQPVNSSPVVARVGDQTITRDELVAPLIQAYGLNLLRNLALLEVAQAEADRAGITVTQADIDAQRERTYAKLFENTNGPALDKIEDAEANGDAQAAQSLREQMRRDNEAALEQVLVNQRMSRPEFDLVVRINATLRKLVEPAIAARVTDQNVEEAYRATYGEKIRVRHIQLRSLQQVNEAKRRLADGEDFAAVAREMSTNVGSKALGGELPPFTRANTGFPQAFRDVAFALQVGQVSDPVQAGDDYHLIKLEERIAPKVIKFEDVKDSVRADLIERTVQAGVTQLRQDIGRRLLAQLQVEDPVLRAQNDEQLAKQRERMQDRDEVRRQIEANRAAETDADVAEQGEEDSVATSPAATATEGALESTSPSTQTDVVPAASATTPAEGQPSPQRPPATMPAAE